MVWRDRAEEVCLFLLTSKSETMLQKTLIAAALVVPAVLAFEHPHLDPRQACNRNNCFRGTLRKAAVSL
jgi:hypothetical protein